MRRLWDWLWPLMLLVAPVLALAQDVPPALKDWQDWVLHDAPLHACPLLVANGKAMGAKECMWPGRLMLDADKDGARFALDVHVDARSWVSLPGDSRNWPQQVTAGGKPQVVLDHLGAPALQLEPGDYSLHGVLPWDSRPARLRVPGSIGLVTLTIDGNAVARIERDGDQLTLGEAAAAQRAADALSLRVFRKLSDGMPAMLETQLQFNVTGSAREQLIGPVLPKGFTATSLQGGLPARLENDGRLRVQLRPGHWVISLGARSGDVLGHIGVNLPGDPWPKQEIWSYADDSTLRTTRVEGQAVDAGQADVPSEWNDLPAYALDNANGLAIEPGTRGGEGGKGDQLTLIRDLWLDFDGRGFSADDRLSGTLTRRQRLDVAAPWQLLNASLGELPMLVTKGDKQASGVEVRDTNLALTAGLRMPGSGAMPSGGWQLPLESIEATLHLPYGYRLIGTSGVDRSPDSWIARWSLLDLFVVALIALLAGRFLGWPWALAATVFLALSLHEGGAPCWTLAVALALALLMRALPEGRLRLVSRIGAGALLLLAILWSLPFAATQMSYALHPQLEGNAPSAPQQQDAKPMALAREQASETMPAPAPAPAPAVEMASTNAVPAPEPPPPMPAPPAPPAPPADIVADQAVSAGYQAKAAKSLESVTVKGSTMPASMTIGQEMDVHNPLQAGRGTPHWDVGNNYHLGWSGPVTEEQTTRLVIAPAWLVRILRVAMLAVLAGLFARLALALVNPAQARLRGWGPRGAAAALLALALLPHGAHAQATPSEQTLNQLRAWLTEAPSCVPDCAALASARFQVEGDNLAMDLEVHAGAPVAVPLPQGDDAMLLQAVSLDGRDAALSRRADATLVRVERGVHHITLRYRLVAVDTASLHFSLLPQRVSFHGEGWAPNGLDEGRLLGDSLALHRVRSAKDGSTSTTIEQAFPPYVKLTRTLQLGNEWTVTNKVERIAPLDGGFSLELPLLPGEHPLGENARVHDGRIGVTFSGGQNEVRWASRLDRSDKLVLNAPALGERAEQWVVQSAPIWHLEAQGLPATLSDNGLTYQPLPGESLQIGIDKPMAVAGDSLAFDGVVVNSRAGDRATETELVLALRSTRGGEHQIDVPAGTELLEAHRDDSPISLVIRDGKISLPVLPGLHRYALRVREPHGVSLFTRAPAFALHAPAANIAMNQTLPESRWVLWTFGPRAGPAVMYWSQLVVLLLAGWLLARYAPTPLKWHQWVLLGLGFSAFAWGAYAMVVTWLILVGLRARYRLPARYGALFNPSQVLLAVVTVAAIAVLVAAVPKGLLGLPDMHVVGNDSTSWSLNWFADQTDGVLPLAGVLSVSLWVYKIAMLLWALWLANALIGWLRWGFEAWSEGGYWRKAKPAAVEPPPVPEAAE